MKLYELINEYCELARICDAAESDYEKNPESAEAEKEVNRYGKS